MYPGGPQQPDFLMDSAARKGWAHGVAASEPSRIIAVNLSSPIPLADSSHRISLNRRQDTLIKDIVREIEDRLPKLEHPFSITTVGAHQKVLGWDTEGEIMELLQPWDASFLNLRLDVHDPARRKPQKKSLGSRLKKVLGRGHGGESESLGGQPTEPSSATERSSSQQPAPPPYEASERSGT